MQLNFTLSPPDYLTVTGSTMQFAIHQDNNASADASA